MSCTVGHRQGSDPVWLWLWLWHRLAAAALIQPLAQELPCAAGLALKIKKKKVSLGTEAGPRSPSPQVRVLSREADFLLGSSSNAPGTGAQEWGGQLQSRQGRSVGPSAKWAKLCLPLTLIPAMDPGQAGPTNPLSLLSAGSGASRVPE